MRSDQETSKSQKLLLVLKAISTHEVLKLWMWRGIYQGKNVLPEIPTVYSLVGNFWVAFCLQEFPFKLK